jgi:multicomponent K+:H+ antiporter subunit G
MSEVPVWVAAVVGVLSVVGALFTLLGCLGLVRFNTFYARVHAPTLGTSFGCIAVTLASMIYFTVSGQRPAVHEVLIVLFVSVTTPVTLMLLARAALYRDRSEHSGDVPDQAGQDVVVAKALPGTALDGSAS